MPRDILMQAVSAVDTACETTTDDDRKERLTELKSSLRSQATRDVTPALGALDRIRAKLQEVEAETTDSTVAEPLADAQNHILTFLGTLDDRGMKQH